MADFSKCLEATVGAGTPYGNFFTKHSGKVAVTACITAAATERIYGRDPTISLTGGTVFWLEYLELNCGSAGLTVLDGSSGARIAGPIGCNSMASGFLSRDMRKDPIACLTADNTSSICIDSTGVGFGSIYMEGYWGVI